jgi:hypothetical protein
VELDGWFLITHIVLKTCIMWNSCTSLVWVLCFISIFLDWRLGFEPTLQLKTWNLRALQNETRMRASILNIDNHNHDHLCNANDPSVSHYIEGVKEVQNTKPKVTQPPMSAGNCQILRDGTLLCDARQQIFRKPISNLYRKIDRKGWGWEGLIN